MPWMAGFARHCLVDRGHHQDRDLARSRLDVLDQVEAAFARHAKVADDQVEVSPGQLQTCLSHACGRDAFEAVGGERHRNRPAHRLFVIDDKNDFLTHWSTGLAIFNCDLVFPTAGSGKLTFRNCATAQRTPKRPGYQTDPRRQ